MKTILVPTDFSDFSNNAIKFATHFARVKGMAVKVLHIIEEPGVLGKIPFLNKGKTEEDLREQEATTREHLERLIALENSDQVKMEYEVRRTKKGVAKEILNEPCDVIVMGRRRLENDQVLLTGSVAEKIVRLSSAPVITIGELPLGFQIKKIVFAGDFREDTSKPVIQRVIDLANIFQAELHFLHVFINREFLDESKGNERAEEIVKNFNLQEAGLEVYFAPTPEDGITDYINEIRPDLLAMCTYGRSGIPHFFLGSVAENMSDYSEVPVLTYNINPKKIDRATTPIHRVVVSRRSAETKEVTARPLKGPKK